jgi:hypothetical protein
MKRKVKCRGKRKEEGYALLFVVFLTAVLVLTTMVASPSVRTERQREKEQEMIWRGKQYTRAIKLYYRKMGKFPTSLDDLVKPSNGNIRFIRQAYKDPMNKEDGSWRLIYVGPAGQLIGSLKPPQTLKLPGVPGGNQTASGALGTGATTAGTSQQGTTGAATGTGSGTDPQTSATALTDGQNQPMPQSSAFGSQSQNQDSWSSGWNSDPQNQQQYAALMSGDPAAVGAATPSGLGSSGTIMGGSIIGIGGKVNKRSLLVYEKAKNYRLFEFVWDPSKDLNTNGQPGMQTGTGLAGQQGIGQNGNNTTGQQSGSSQQNNQQNQQNQNQNQNQQQQQ